MKTIAVIFGGRSAEHDVSIITALASIIKPLTLRNDYQIEAVYIAKDGSWYWDEKLKDIALYQSGDLQDFLKRAPKVQLMFDQGLTLVKSSQFAGRKMYRKIDIVFPAMHGTYGEDGALMGLLDMANVPYVGCGVAASAVAMDKVLTKQVAATAGILSTPWLWFTAPELTRDPTAVVQKISTLRYPLFVKPALLGSSIGISHVTSPDQLMNALEVATHFDDKVIVEQAVQNLIEVTVPVMGNDSPVAAMVEQPLTQAGDFFDFETKYMGSGKKMGGTKGAQGYSKIPADIDKGLYQSTEDMALATYRALGCSGIARNTALKVVAKTGKALTALPGLRRFQTTLRRKLYAGIGSTDYITANEMRQIFLHTINEDLRQNAAAITTPTLLIWGEADTETPLSDGQALAHLISSATLVTIAAAGHYTHLDAPAETLTHIRRFLS